MEEDLYLSQIGMEESKMRKFKIKYFDEIEATDLEQAKEFLLSHLQSDVDNSDVTCFEIEEITNESCRIL